MGNNILVVIREAAKYYLADFFRKGVTPSPPPCAPLTKKPLAEMGGPSPPLNGKSAKLIWKKNYPRGVFVLYKV